MRRVAIAFAPLAVLAALIALGVPLCPTRHLLGIPCPGCGLTRATEALAHGDFAAMVHFHPLAPIFAPLLAIALLRTTLVGAGLWRNRRDAMGRVPSWVWGALVVVLLGVYVARMAGGLGGMPDPIAPHEGLLFRAGQVLLRSIASVECARQVPTQRKEEATMARLIREVMTSAPRVLSSSATVAEAARIMREENIGDVIVEENGTHCGIVTDRDIVVRAVAAGKNAAETPIKEVYTAGLTTLSPQDSIDEAIRLMREKAIRRIPIVENGRAVGIVSLGDLAIERDEKSVLGQVSAARPNN